MIKTDVKKVDSSTFGVFYKLYITDGEQFTFMLKEDEFNNFLEQGQKAKEKENIEIDEIEKLKNENKKLKNQMEFFKQFKHIEDIQKLGKENEELKKLLNK